MLIRNIFRLLITSYRDDALRVMVLVSYSHIAWCSTLAHASCVVVSVVAKPWLRTHVNVSACPTASRARQTMSMLFCFQ